MKKFWQWKNQAVTEEATPAERTLYLNGTIAEESWFDDDVTPQLFMDDLVSGEGDISVWINSPGGDCIAAAQIYNMLKEYPGHVTVKIDGLAASAASVIAMAGDNVLMSPVSMMMIHNPATMAFGDHAEMQKAIDMLAEVKESILNAYVIKSGLSRAKLSHLMDAETWMNANKAIELGLCDGILERAQSADKPEEEDEEEQPKAVEAVAFSRKAVNNALFNKITAKFKEDKPDAAKQAHIQEPETNGPTAASLREKLDLIEKYI